MRRHIVIVLTLATLATSYVAAHSFYSAMEFYDNGQWPPTYVRINNGILWTQFVDAPSVSGRPRRFSLPGFVHEERYQRNWAKTGNLRTTQVSVSLLLPFFLFALYPLFRFVRGPIHYVRCRSRRVCVSCGYSLVGNVSGMCPECGIACKSRVAPKWKRAVIAVLATMVVGWFVEFANIMLKFEQHLGNWMFELNGDESGVWLIVSSVRTIICAVACVAVYVYVSPERLSE